MTVLAGDLLVAAAAAATGSLALRATRRRRSTLPGSPAGLRGAASERGQSCIEMALVLPVFLIVFSAAVEFGVVLADGVSLAGAARDGARAGAMAGLTSTAAVQDAQSAAAAAATDLISCAPQSPQATYGGDAVGDMTVTVSCAYHPVTPLGPLVTAFLGGGGDEPSTLTATESWRINQ